MTPRPPPGARKPSGALPAAAVGFVLSRATLDFGVRLMFKTLPDEFVPYMRVLPLEPDVRVLGFMLFAACASAVLFGLAPAIQATRPSVVQASRGNFDAEPRPARLRNALIVAQVTACVLLLVCAGVLLRGARGLQRLDVGFTTRDVIQMNIVEKLRPRVLARLALEPDVQGVAAAAFPPLDGVFPSVPLATSDRRRSSEAFYNLVSPDYFTVLQIPIVRGRNFAPGESRSQAAVAIVSAATAAKLWPHDDPLGQRVHLAFDTPGSRWAGIASYQDARIVGVARDVVSGQLVFGVDPAIVYFPTSPAAWSTRLLVRVSGDAEQVRRRLDADLATLDPGAVEQLHKMEQYVVGAVYPFRVAWWVSSAVGLIALLLTVTGIYGVLSYVVSQRSREIGIRMALGASTSQVVGLVLRQLLRMAGLGIAIGTLLALAMSRIFASFLFGVMMNTFDAFAYAGGMLGVLVACLGAAWVPSRRAARIDPATTLRTD